MWTSLERKFRKNGSKESQGHEPTSHPTQQNSLFSNLKSLTTGSLQKISKLSPYIHRKLHLSSASSSKIVSSRAPELPNTCEILPSICISGDPQQLQESHHLDKGEYLEVKEESEFSAAELTLPWRRSPANEASLSVAFNERGSLEDCPRLDDSLSSHSPSSTAAVMRLVPSTHHHHYNPHYHHHHSHYHHHHHFHHNHHNHHHQHHHNSHLIPHTYPDNTISLPTPMSSDSARGSSVASTGGDAQNASSSSQSIDCHLHADLGAFPAWSRSNSHDLPTVQEEEVDEHSYSIGNKKPPADTGYCANYRTKSQCEAQTFDGSTYLCTDQKCNINLISQSLPATSENDYPDIPKIDTPPSVVWCFNDSSSPPIPSDRCRHGEFIRDALDQETSPHRLHPCFQGMHRDSYTDKTSSLRARYMSAHSMRCSDNNDCQPQVRDSSMNEQMCPGAQAAPLSSDKEFSDVSESLEGSCLEVSCEERVLHWLLTSNPYLFEGQPDNEDEEPEENDR